MKKTITAALIFALAGAVVAQVEPPKMESYVPANGFVSDATTAVVVAVAILSPIYGEGKIRAEAPFIATLNDDVWTVVGTLPHGLKGGVARIQISKVAGKILNVSHGK